MNEWIKIFIDLIRNEPVGIALVCGGLLLLVFAAVWLWTIRDDERHRKDKKISLIVAGIGVLLLGCGAFWIWRTIEIPYTIYPTITNLADNSKVTSPLTVEGTVKRVPKYSSLWLAAYNSKIRLYCFANVVVDQNKKWTTTVTLVDGMVGDKYDVNLILAPPDQYDELVRCKRTPTNSLPLGVRICNEITVTLTQQ